jgi:hypothetical protein
MTVAAMVAVTMTAETVNGVGGGGVVVTEAAAMEVTGADAPQYPKADHLGCTCLW